MLFSNCSSTLPKRPGQTIVGGQSAVRATHSHVASGHHSPARMRRNCCCKTLKVSEGVFGSSGCFLSMTRHVFRVHTPRPGSIRETPAKILHPVAISIFTNWKTIIPSLMMNISDWRNMFPTSGELNSSSCKAGWGRRPT